MPRADSIENNWVKCAIAGPPKGAGKSTIAASFPTPSIILNFDGGRVTIPPGVDRSKIYVRNYPSVDFGLWNESSTSWKRPLNVGKLIIQDLKEIGMGLWRGEPIKLVGEEEPWPCPTTLVLDGWVELSNHIMNWLLGSNQKADPEDWGRGEGVDALKFWGKRLNKLETILAGVVPYPCNIVICTWTMPELKSVKNMKGQTESVPTGRLIPDMGGKLAVRGPGKVDSAIYAYSTRENDGTHYWVQTKPDGVKVDWVGVRDSYGRVDPIDVTIGPDKILPYQRIWGN